MRTGRRVQFDSSPQATPPPDRELHTKAPLALEAARRPSAAAPASPPQGIVLLREGDALRRKGLKAAAVRAYVAALDGFLLSAEPRKARAVARVLRDFAPADPLAIAAQARVPEFDPCAAHRPMFLASLSTPAPDVPPSSAPISRIRG